jgi:hypothetical protein
MWLPPILAINPAGSSADSVKKTLSSRRLFMIIDVPTAMPVSRYKSTHVFAGSDTGDNDSDIKIPSVM